MIERNYYCLVAGLPDLVADDKKLAFSSVQLREMLHDDLNGADFKLAQLFFLPFDHKNILNLLYKKDFDWDDRGNFSRDKAELLVDRKLFELEDLSEFPAYIIGFMNNYYGDEGIADAFKADMLLTSGYFEYLDDCRNVFVKEVALMDRNIGNIMAALNGRKYNLPFTDNLVGNNEITEALIRSRARDFGLTSDVADVETMIQIFENTNLLEREFKIDLYRWNKLDEMTFFNYFTIEKVISFLLKLFIVERWFHLDKEKGQQMFNKILKDIESDFQFPDEFTLTYGKKK